MTAELFDYVIVGGGIVGLSTAMQLQERQPTKRIALIEKEASLAQHQTGHNSGVIHAGVYYAPGSLKADFCKRGLEATLAFCQQHNIDFQQPGKLIVATSSLELERLRQLQQRCLDNHIEAHWLDQIQLQQKEPQLQGLAALFIQESGIVDYQHIAQTMAARFQQMGGTLMLSTPLVSVSETPQHCLLETHQHILQSRYVICCAGLMADRLCRLFSIDPAFDIIPFRGEYYQLPPNKSDIVKHLIYPVPDPALPFLGIHLTPMIDGSMTVGPNALLGWKREGYARWNINLKDSVSNLNAKGFWRLLNNYKQAGFNEFFNSLFKKRYLNAIQKYCPALTLDDLKPYPAGVRAQAVNHNGELIHDFLFAETTRSFHVCNAPSPAATSSLPIGEYICDQVEQRVQELKGLSSEI